MQCVYYVTTSNSSPAQKLLHRASEQERHDWKEDVAEDELFVEGEDVAEDKPFLEEEY